MSTLVTILHVGVCLFLMVTVLLQSGKGGGVGAAFGAGGSQTVFGSSGGGNFLRRLTVACAAVFMLTSITLAYMASSTGSDALRRYSEQQRQYSESMKAAREEALKQQDTGTENTEATTPTGEQPAEGITPTGEQPVEGAAPTGEQPAEGTTPAAELPAEGAAAPAGEQPAEGAAAPAAPAGQGATPNP